MNILNLFLKPLFNVYDLIIWMLIFQSLTFCVLLLVRGERHISHKYLAIFIASLGFGQLTFLCIYNIYIAGFLNKFINESGFALITWIFYIQGYLLKKYLYVLTGKKPNFKLLDIAPIITLLLVSYFSPIFWTPFLVEHFWRPFVLTSVVGFFVSLCYGVSALLFIRQYSELLKDHFCNLEQLSIFWLKAFVCGYLCIWLFQMIPPLFYGWSPKWFEQIIIHLSELLSLIMMNIVFFAGLLNAQKIKRISFKTNSTDVSNQADEKIPHEHIDILKQKIRQQIIEESLFAKPNMNLERMAKELNLSARQLSQLINREFNQNYFEFINAFRLETTKSRLISPEWSEKSVQEIYESVGFSSKSSFFTVFRKHTSMTPIEYRERYRELNLP